MRSVTFVALLVVTLSLSSCSEQTASGQKAQNRWVLLSAPQLLPEQCNPKEPCTGTVYVRAPLSDWERHGEFDSFEQCGAKIWAPKPDPHKELHVNGKLSNEEKMLGFKCVSTTDKRLSSPPPYDWEKESLSSE